MLKNSSLLKLQNKRNLLAFSGGVDSSALFFLLIEKNIDFDIAIVDYGIREQSKEEVAYAIELAHTYSRKCHLHKAQKIENNFEANARALRYNFFEELVESYHYDNLITAHHLGDRFEWMLMQFCKGSGCAELSGMKEFQARQNYHIVRPLLHLDKEELLEYLKHQKIKYFEDESNNDESIKRNAFRHQHTKPLLAKYLDGIKKSFEYIDADIAELIEEIEVETIEDFAYFKNSSSKRSNIYAIDKYLKSCHHIITANERELLKSQKSLVVGRKFLISQMPLYTFIAPYIQKKMPLDGEFKEECRKLKIEPKLREYFALKPTLFLIFKKLFGG